MYKKLLFTAALIAVIVYFLSSEIIKITVIYRGLDKDTSQTAASWASAVATFLASIVALYIGNKASIDAKVLVEKQSNKEKNRCTLRTFIAISDLRDRVDYTKRMSTEEISRPLPAFALNMEKIEKRYESLCELDLHLEGHSELGDEIYNLAGSFFGVYASGIQIKEMLDEKGIKTISRSVLATNGIDVTRYMAALDSLRGELDVLFQKLMLEKEKLSQVKLA
jgi:hypothetical protein